MALAAVYLAIAAIHAALARFAPPELRRANDAPVRPRTDDLPRLLNRRGFADEPDRRLARARTGKLVGSDRVDDRRTQRIAMACPSRSALRERGRQWSRNGGPPFPAAPFTSGRPGGTRSLDLWGRRVIVLLVQVMVVPRSDRATARRRQIVEATIATIAELGYLRASFVEIAKRAELSISRAQLAKFN